MNFLQQISEALGFAAMPPDKKLVIKEILRLREAAGELEAIRRPFELETLAVESVRGVPNAGPSKLCALWFTTKAQAVKSMYQARGLPPRHDLLEMPQRDLSLLLTEEQAREVYRILDETIRSWS